MDFEARGWKGRSRSDLRRVGADFYRCLVEYGADAGQIRWYRLLADGEPIAMYLCYRSQGTVWAIKTAYDERFASYSPGSVLLLRILQYLCADSGVGRMHMLTGPDWLARWGPSVEEYFRFRVFQTSTKGRLLYLAERIRGRLRPVRSDTHPR